MKAIIQRVSGAAVAVDGKTVGEVSKGFLILLGVAQGDDEKEAQVLADKISGLRVFTDPNDKMNLALADIDGEVLVISNFTLCADCSRYFCERLRQNGVKKVAQGVFGADMQVSLVNDGPVTIDIDSKDLKR